MNNYAMLKKKFIISTNKSKLDVALIHNYLSKESYWAKNIPIDTVRRSIKGAVCFGVYEKQNEKKQIGFARVITDKATYGYLADVFILEPYRGIGLSKWMMHEILNHPDLQHFRRWMLATRDAHGLYAQFGFTPIDNPERFMRLSLLDAYPEI
jgi:N-acetylglutamate synthase-like GNAT family acetyltransferase